MAGVTGGEATARPDRAAHVRGVRQSNRKGSYDESPGHLPDDRSTARRSTGINARLRDPIMPGMPNLSPS